MRNLDDSFDDNEALKSSDDCWKFFNYMTEKFDDVFGVGLKITSVVIFE